MVAVPEVDRHPLYVAYYTQLERENTRCLLRASARNKMKRFITDVHTVWLTNLAHHPEFRRMTRGTAMIQEEGDRDSGGGSGGGNGNGLASGKAVHQPETMTPVTASRRGLGGGRDSAAIAASHSQIQSVNPERAFRGAFFFSSTSKGPSSSPLQPAAEGTDQKSDQRGGQQARPKGTAMEQAAYNSLSYGREDGSENGETPELPPPPFTAPTLAMLVSERRRLTNVSTSGSANIRGSLSGGGGGGPRRRSMAGGGGGGGGDAGAWLDMSARVLRVLRFAPPPPPPPAMEKVSQDAGHDVDDGTKGSGDRRFSEENTLAVTTGNGVDTAGNTAASPPPDTEASRQDGRTPPHERAPSPAPAPKATWMISSFHPYDGSETRVMIGDVAVSKVVGEALSASSPLATAGQPDVAALTSSKKERAEGVSGSSGPIPLAPEGPKETGARLLVLRRGVRVPVLGEGGGVVGKVLSVVEVRCRFFEHL